MNIVSEKYGYQLGQYGQLSKFRFLKYLFDLDESNLPPLPGVDFKRVG
jgi:hypothetical protein